MLSLIYLFYHMVYFTASTKAGTICNDKINKSIEEVICTMKEKVKIFIILYNDP